jgi:hypothetical protein
MVESGAQVFGGEVWVEVPPAFSLALLGTLPDPASDPVRVSFSLGSAAPARLEVLDVAGRRSSSRAFAGLGPGRHVVTMAGTMPAAGVYFLRLTQGDRAVVRRVVRMR